MANKFLLDNLKSNPAVAALSKACAEAFSRRGFRHEAEASFSDVGGNIDACFHAACADPEETALVGMMFILDRPHGPGGISARTTWRDGPDADVEKIHEACPCGEELDALLSAPAGTALSPESADALVGWIGRALDRNSRDRPERERKEEEWNGFGCGLPKRA